eukprot:s780_g13.t2
MVIDFDIWDEVLTLACGAMDCQSVAAQPGRLLGLRVAPVPFAAGWWQAHAWQMRLESPGYWNDWRHRVTLKPGLPAILKFSKDLLQWGTCVQAPKILKELVGGSRNQKQGSRCVFRMCLPEATAQSSQACGGGSINPTSEGWQNSALCIRGDVVEHHVSVLVHLCHSAREVSPPHVFGPAASDWPRTWLPYSSSCSQPQDSSSATCVLLVRFTALRKRSTSSIRSMSSGFLRAGSSRSFWLMLIPPMKEVVNLLKVGRGMGITICGKCRAAGEKSLLVAPNQILPSRSQ